MFAIIVLTLFSSKLFAANSDERDHHDG